MIKFFRSLRRKVLPKNRTSRYFFYTIGEIILVVIGILIALQIHTWSDYNKERAFEQKLLQNILADLIKDEQELNLIEGVVGNQITLMDSLFIKMEKSKKMSTQEFISHNFSFPYFSSFLCTKGTYVESLSSGNLSLILSDTVRNQILDYYEVQIHTLGADDLMQNEIKQLIPKWLDIMAQSPEYLNVTKAPSIFKTMSIEGILADLEYRHLWLRKYGLSRGQINGWKVFRDTHIELKNLIQKELDKRFSN